MEEVSFIHPLAAFMLHHLPIRFQPPRANTTMPAEDAIRSHGRGGPTVLSMDNPKMLVTEGKDGAFQHHCWEWPSEVSAQTASAEEDCKQRSGEKSNHRLKE